MKSKKNIFFIIAVIFLMSLIGLFTYTSNPFGYKNIPDRLSIYQYPFTRINLLMKKSKYKKYDILIVGGSTENTCYLNVQRDKRVALVTVTQPYITEMRELINNFISIHPETKLVIFDLPFFILLNRNRILDEVFPKWTGKNLNLEEIIYLLFSYDAIKMSIDKLNGVYTGEIELRCYPSIKKEDKVSSRTLSKSLSRNFDAKQANEIYNLVDDLHAKGVKVVGIIPPLHILAIIQNYKYNRDAFYSIMNFEKELVEKNVFDEFYTIYDTSYFAKYCLEDNMLYYDLLHPKYFYSLVIDEILSGEKGKYSYLYDKLTPENIDYHIKRKQNEIEKYISENKEYIEKVGQYGDNHSKKVFYDKSPKKIQKFMDEANEKIFNENNNNLLNSY